MGAWRRGNGHHARRRRSCDDSGRWTDDRDQRLAGAPVPDRDGRRGGRRPGRGRARAPGRGRRLGPRGARPRVDGDRSDRRPRAARQPVARRHRRRRPRPAGLEALQARLARDVAGVDGDPGPRPPHRGPALRSHRRPVHGRVARADAGDRPRGPRRRREHAPRRRVQAAHLPLQLPRPRRRGAGDPRRGARGDRPAGRHRAARSAPHGAGGRDGRRDPDRRPQHVELPAALRGRARPTGRCCSSAARRRRSTSC